MQMLKGCWPALSPDFQSRSIFQEGAVAVLDTIAEILRETNTLLFDCGRCNNNLWLAGHSSQTISTVLKGVNLVDGAIVQFIWQAPTEEDASLISTH